MVKKLFALPKFGSFRGRTSASLKIGEILAIWHIFEPGDEVCTYFALYSLGVDKFITYTNR